LSGYWSSSTPATPVPASSSAAMGSKQH
jgi:hypothetical protein